MTGGGVTWDLGWDPAALAERASTASLEASAEKVRGAPHATDILEAFPGPALILNPQRQVIGANEAALEAFAAPSLAALTGSRPGEVVKCKIALAEPQGCGTGEACRHCGVLGSILQSVVTKKRARGEGLLSTTDGGTINVEVAVNCIEIEKEPLLFLGFRDISAEKHREFLQGAFLHDLMNTAGGLQGLLAISREDRTESDALIPVIERLVKSIVDEIEGHRHLLRAEQGNLRADWSSFELDSGLAQIVTLYRAHPVARGRNLSLEATTAAFVVTDGTLFRRVVGNMIKNALEATPEGETVSVTAGATARGIEVSVHNPAVIPDEVRVHIFKRGFSTKGQGRGTGTHAMRVLTERYLGGTVAFQSGPDTGTRFVLQLPIQPPDVRESAGKDVFSDSEPLRLDGIRIVVADDDAVNRRVAAHRLGKLGADVELVESGEAAVDAARARRAEVVLLDVEMPGIGGLEAAARLRNSGPDRPRIVMVSGHDAPDSRAEPFDLWIAKPLRDADLQRVARNLRDAPSR
jgi:hypothetical protein